MYKLIIAVLFVIALSGCDFEQMNRDAQTAREYKHELRKFNIGSKDNPAQGWYFLVAGGYTGKSSEAMVRFYYKTKGGEFAFMEKPLGMVNIKIEGVVKPYATLDYSYDPREESTRVVIHCREQDFQPEININSLR